MTEKQFHGDASSDPDGTVDEYTGEETQISVEFLRLINASIGLGDLIRAATGFFQEQSGCEAVGIRLREGDDYPYYETHGFSQEFVVAENSLCVLRETGKAQQDGNGNPALDCMCGNVICGRFDSAKPFFTAAGSFWTNSTTELLACTTAADRQARTRNRCNGEGYESVALIRLHSGQETLGLLQFNDRRRDRFTAQSIAFWERLAGYLAVALAKSRAEEKLSASEDCYRSLFNKMTEGFALHEIVCDEHGEPCDYRFLDLNPAFERLTGLNRDDLIGRTMRDVLPNEEPGWIKTYGKVALTGQPVHFDSYSTALDRYYDVFAYSPATRQFAVLFTDIGERKHAEEALVRARQAADAANRAKSEFLTNMSHELRTPMTAVLGFSDVLLMSPELSPGEQREFLEAIQRNGKALLGLIDDILDLSRIEADRLQLDKTDCPLQQLIDDLLSAVEVQAEQKKLSLDVDYRFPLPETIYTDAARLRQVLVNLAGNAVKFTGQGGVRVTVGCTCEADGMGRMQFAISDTGIGIAADKIEELFQPFVQADASSTRYYGGTGLGLTISRRLAKALGGDIEVTSQAGKGSTFTLTIDAGPMKGVRWLQSLQAARPPEPPLPDDPQPSLHGRVLFAEDVPGVQVLIAFLLKRMNLEVDLAGDGRAVCAMAEKSQAEGRPYDLIFMDIQMPEMNGYEATRRLRQQGWQGPIVALTAHAMVGDREKCLAAGCDDYLSKPVSPQGLREVLARYIPARDAATVTCRVEPPDAQATPHTSIERLRERFINGLPERAQVLEDAWRAGNRLALAQAAHQLKGTAGAYGLSRVAQAAQTVELLVTGESIPPETAPAMAELLRLCVQARSEPCGAAGHE